MAFSRLQAGQNPMLLIAIKRDTHIQRLCRAVSRIWDTPEFHIEDTVNSAMGHVIARSLQGNNYRPDIVIVDLEEYSADARALFDTIRSISGLRHTPLVALIDTASADTKDRIYEAGADLVLAWEALENRIGDLAGLAVDNWLNTEPEADQKPQSC